MARPDFDGLGDAELVARAGRGDKAAFAELVVRHRPLALAVCSRFLGSQDLACDVVQDATVVALVGLERLAVPERFGAWLCGIALNVARQWLRDQQRRSHVALDQVPERPAGDMDPAERAELADLGERVRRAVARLSPGQREAVWLFYLRGLTHREVAAELGISVNAVKARLHQGRAALEVRLVDHALPPLRKEPSVMISDQFIDMRVSQVRRGPGADDARHVVVLEEAAGGRHLPIWVGPAEAIALAVSLEAVELPRPMTYRFAASLLAATGGAVTEVRITRLREGTFYAVVLVEGPAGPGEVDARPSDAVNLAVVTGIPVRVDAALLDNPAVTQRTEWQDYEVAGAAIAVEVQAAIDEQRHQCEPPTPPDR